MRLFEFVEIPFPPPFASLARRRACPDLVAAPTSLGLLIELSPPGLPPSVPDFAIQRELISARKEAGESQTPGPEA